MVVRWLSGGCAAVVRRLSGGGPVVVRWWSGGCPVVLRWLCGGGPVVVVVRCTTGHQRTPLDSPTNSKSLGNNTIRPRILHWTRCSVRVRTRSPGGHRVFSTPPSPGVQSCGMATRWHTLAAHNTDARQWPTGLSLRPKKTKNLPASGALRPPYSAGGQDVAVGWPSTAVG